MDSGYKDLKAWKRAMDIAELAYQLVQKLPVNERFGLADQIRRAAVSIPSNIAEGRGRLSPADFNRFLGMARGSLYELETQVILVRRLELIEDKEFGPLLDAIQEEGRIIQGLITSNHARQE